VDYKKGNVKNKAADIMSAFVMKKHNCQQDSEEMNLN
jgi:hypothetical protein